MEGGVSVAWAQPEIFAGSGLEPLDGQLKDFLTYSVNDFKKYSGSSSIL